MTLEFAFYDFVDASGVNNIVVWLHGIPPRCRAHFEALITYLAAIRPGQQTRPGWDKLDADCDGLYELRAKDGKVQYRLLAAFGPGRREVNLLFGARKQGARQFVPANACALAKGRLELIVKDTAKYRREHGTK